MRDPGARQRQLLEKQALLTKVRKEVILAQRKAAMQVKRLLEKPDYEETLRG